MVNNKTTAKVNVGSFGKVRENSSQSCGHAPENMCRTRSAKNSIPQNTQTRHLEKPGRTAKPGFTNQYYAFVWLFAAETLLLLPQF